MLLHKDKLDKHRTLLRRHRTLLHRLKVRLKMERPYCTYCGAPLSPPIFWISIYVVWVDLTGTEITTILRRPFCNAGACLAWPQAVQGGG